jgi:hypothetical protein
LAEASSLLARRNAGSSRAARTRSHPSVARARAMARPMPRVAPVTRATWPRRREDLGILIEVRSVKVEEAFGVVGTSYRRMVIKNPHFSRKLRARNGAPGTLTSKSPPSRKETREGVGHLVYIGSNYKVQRQRRRTGVSLPHLRDHWDAGGSGRGTRSAFLLRCGSSRASRR